MGREETLDDFSKGVCRFIVGFGKKILLANNFAIIADMAFCLNKDELSVSFAWIGAIAYTLQIYFDFSGYSDMAIGLARTMGFIFPENFNHPYISQSITEFWGRWHISLSRWMRDYLYIPLGGNKVSVPRLYFNLCFVFLISGFWHGAQWTFIFWGAYHGLFLVLDRLVLLKLTAKIGKLTRVILTFFIVVIGWIFFRSDTVGQAFQFLEKMFSFSYKEYFFENHFIFIFIIAALISFVPLFRKLGNLEYNINIQPLSVGRVAFNVLIIIVCFTICVAEITSKGFNPFIYFKF